MGNPVIDKRILIIEDDAAMREILVDRFTAAGFSVVMAEDGKTALDMALELHPDLLVLDILLPKVDGLTILRWLGKDEWGKTVPVIVLSNLSDAVAITKSMKDGVHDFFVKAECEIGDVVQKAKERLGVKTT